MALLYSDSFTAADTGNINGRTLDNALGGSEAKQWVVSTGNTIGIDSNEAQSFGTAAAAMIHETRTEGDVWVRFRFWNSDTQAILYARTTVGRLGPGVGVIMDGRSNLRILELDGGSRYGTYVASAAVTTIDLDTNYHLRLTKSGGEVSGRLYGADQVTLLGTVSHDFGATVFSNEYWGFSNYEMENAKFKNFEFRSLDAPPGGNALLLQLMQHGQFNGGLL